MSLSTDLIDIISSYCGIRDFINVDKYNRYIVMNRASNIVTQSIRDWVIIKQTPCHEEYVIDSMTHICLQSVRSRFNEFDRPYMKMILAKEFINIRFNFIVNEIGIDFDNDINHNDITNIICLKMSNIIIRDCFDDVEFDIQYPLSLLLNIYRDTRSGDIDMYSDEVYDSFKIAIYNVLYIVKKWSCNELCDAIERVTKNKHHVIMFDP